jgi:uncharacterized membrane protein YvlD (DUF360 family)
MTETPVQRKKVKRPRSVIILVIFQLLQSLTLLTYGSFRVVTAAWPGNAWEFSLDFLATMLVQVITSGAGLLILGLFTLIISGQLFRMKAYAWLMAMSLQGIILLTSLIAYLRHEPNYLLMTFGVVLVFYLNLNDIRAVMWGGRETI